MGSDVSVLLGEKTYEELEAMRASISKKMESLGRELRLVDEVLALRLPTGPPTEEELEAAEKRLQPYLDGYPEPMIDTRRLRKSNGTATPKDLRELAAEDQVIRKIREARGGG